MPSNVVSSGMKNKKILFTASEVTPIAKVGGLGDVVGALPKALKKLGLDVRIIIPFYGLIDRNHGGFKLVKEKIKVETAVAEESVNLFETSLPGSVVPVYLIEHDFFKGQNIYSGNFPGAGGLYPNDLAEIEKFVFFSHALLASIRAIGFRPELIHLNDWHTAAVALYLKTLYKNDPFFNKIATVYTIHNLANQGIADPEVITLNKISPNLASILEDRKDQNINFMVQGILNSDLINTVSPTYSQEILTKEYGAGLERVLALRKKRLYGIVNGIDTDFYNPLTDKLIAKNYSKTTLEKKLDNKLALQKKLGLPADKTMALAGVVTRFVWQKGLELITEKFSELNCQFVLLGTGEKRYEAGLLYLANKYPNQFSVQIKFDEKMAHEIYAGSDIFLVPSRFEPCGLTQMIAMRYASVPIVRATGGLKDTVAPLIKGVGGIKPTGFTFKKFTATEFYKIIKKALKLYYERPDAWRQLQVNGMTKNFSWEKSAKAYLKLYKKIIKIKK